MYNLGSEYDRLRDYQLECTTSIFDTFNDGDKSTMAILPMSAGKTVIVGAVIHRYLNRHPHRVAVMLSHLDILTQQNEESLSEFWKLDTGILQAHRIPKANKNCIISTMQSFSTEDKVDFWGRLKDVGLVVVDEAHLYGSKSYDDIVDRLPEDCIILGVTATPFRDNKDMTSMFDSVSYTISMQELIDRGMLVPPILHNFPVYKGEDKYEIHKKIISIYHARHIGEKSIIFLKTIEECEKLENLFKTVGIKAKAVTSKFTGNKRHECIADFKNNEYDSADVLITVSVLTAGFSSNNVRSIFMPYQISSVAAYLQRIGRGMRLDEGKDHVDVYVGGESPQLTQEMYEKIQRQALEAGRPPTQEEIEAKEELEREEYEESHDDNGIEYNAETMRLAEDLKKTGLKEVAKMIKETDFPQELLDNLVSQRLVKSKILTSKKPTDKEIKFLTKNGMYRHDMNALEALYASSALLASKGIDPRILYVQQGKHKGIPYQAVAPMQVKYLAQQDKRSFYAGRVANKRLYLNLDVV